MSFLRTTILSFWNEKCVIKQKPSLHVLKAQLSQCETIAFTC